jgi:TatD DNase family protein
MILMLVFLASQHFVHGFTTRTHSFLKSPFRIRTSHHLVSMSSSSSLKFVDIGANLMDDRYRKGEYFGKERHEPDFDSVLERSKAAGVTHLILTAGTLEESRQALQVVREYRQERKLDGLFLGCTVGVHPTRCQQEFVDNVASSSDASRSVDDVLQELLHVAQDGVQDGSVVALGEIGLDYDRLQFSPKDVQKEFLRRQLETFLSSSEVASLPLFLHNRSVGRDLLMELQQHKEAAQLRGVVHSFDDTLELAQEIINMGLYIGLNGCSLKTKENLEVVRELPLSSILLETDCPYCEIKPTHAGFLHVKTTFEKMAEKKFVMGMGVKGRSEPNQIIQVAEVIAGVKGISLEEVAKACYENSMSLYRFESAVTIS